MKTIYCPVGRLMILALWLATLLGGASASVRAEEHFNSALLEIDNQQQSHTDLSVFEQKPNQASGTYRVDIYINNELLDTRDVVFSMQKNAVGKESLQPCLSAKALAEVGVKIEAFPQLGDSECADLSAIPQASAEFRLSTQQLLISIPQAAITDKARGYVEPSQWDDGITALLLNYSVSGAQNSPRNGKNNDSNSQYANLRPGFNIGPWRLSSYITWNRSSGRQDQWDTVYTYVQRNIIALKSQLILGDSNSLADVFDGVPFRGAQLASDDDMVPDSLKGYAPVVRGIAHSNAEVTIRQNGYVVYQHFVAPGAFEITDMFPTGTSGDLHVTVKEADGSEQLIVVPFASLPVLQREGRLKYALTGGQYRSYNSRIERTPFVQGTGTYGFPYGITIYGGIQGASHYQSLACGLGDNLGKLGAVSVDVTYAQATMQNQPQRSGQSLRTRYSKDMAQTGTNIAIAGYRYATAGYYNLQETLDSYRKGQNTALSERRRNRAEATMTQSLWQEIGSVSLSLVNEDYWNSNRRLQSYGVDYNNSWHKVSYGMNYSYNLNFMASSAGSGKKYGKDQVIAFNISVPLAILLGNTYASYTMNTSKKGSTTQIAGLKGTALAGNNLSWNAQQGYGSQRQGNSGNLAADYRGTYGAINAGYAYDNDMQRVNYGVQGGIVAHSDGVTFGQPLGETIALVKAPGAKSVELSSQTGVKTDYRGYAIVPYISPYRKNKIALNSATLSDDVELNQNTQNVVPTRGAVVRASFVTQIGGRAMMTLLRPDGAPVPFGATVSDMATKGQGFIVGDTGQVYLTGLADSGQLIVKWGHDTSQQCHVDYSLSGKIETNSVHMLHGQCG
ncbi:TPA: fimbria/pilus outer membrane usher protein [Yersinia enterocolitica]